MRIGPIIVGPTAGSLGALPGFTPHMPLLPLASPGPRPSASPKGSGAIAEFGWCPGPAGRDLRGLPEAALRPGLPLRVHQVFSVAGRRRGRGPLLREVSWPFRPPLPRTPLSLRELHLRPRGSGGGPLERRRRRGGVLGVQVQARCRSGSLSCGRDNGGPGWLEQPSSRERRRHGRPAGGLPGRP